MSDPASRVKQNGVQTDLPYSDTDHSTQTQGTIPNPQATSGSFRVAVFGTGPAAVRVAREHTLAGNEVCLYRNTSFPQRSAVPRPDLYTTAQYEGFTINEETIDFTRTSITEALAKVTPRFDQFFIDTGTSLTSFSGTYIEPLPEIHCRASFYKRYTPQTSQGLRDKVVLVLGSDDLAIELAKYARKYGAEVTLIAGQHLHRPFREKDICLRVLYPPYNVGEKNFSAFDRSDRTTTIPDVSKPLYHYFDTLVVVPDATSLINYDQTQIGLNSTYVQRDTRHNLELTQ